MAQTLFFNVTADPVTTADLDNQALRTLVARGTSASGGLTVSIDLAKVPNITTLKACLAKVLVHAQGGKELNP